MAFLSAAPLSFRPPPPALTPTTFPARRFFPAANLSKGLNNAITSTAMLSPPPLVLPNTTTTTETTSSIFSPSPSPFLLRIVVLKVKLGDRPGVVIVKIPFQLGLSKMDLRKMLKSSLFGVDKSISAMYKKLQKNLTSEELLPSLWDKCKKEFLDKYDSFVQLVANIYPNENVPSMTDMRELLASM